MRFTQLLQRLESITWRYATHHAKDGRRREAEQLIREHYDRLDLESRGVEHAIVVSSYHGGDGHKKEHITVEFKDAEGLHVTTHHVRGPRDNK